MTTSPPSSATSELWTPSSTADLLAHKWPALARYWPTLPKASAKQGAFLCLDQLEAFFGGAAGPGKTDVLLAGALQYVDVPGYSAIIFRRTFADLDLPGAAMDRAKSWLRPQVPWDDRGKTFTFPSGATLTFGYLQHEGDELRYKSAEFQYIGFDELTQFLEAQYVYLFSRLRAVEGIDVPLRQRAASNPGDIGHLWVKERFITHRDRDVIFIPATLDDHPDARFKERYRESLAKLDPVTRRQYEEGDWDVAAGLAFNVNNNHLVDRFVLEDAMDRFEALDYGFNGAPWCLWVVDYEGNLIAVDMRYWRDKLPSDLTPEIIEARKAGWGLSNAVFADPSLWHRTGGKNRWGEPAKLADEFADNGVTLTAANNDPRAGMARIRELLKIDTEHLFPPWHERAGQPGAPRVFFTADVQLLVDELRTAPLQPMTKPDGGEKINPQWESRHGHAVAMCRYAVMSRPGPSEKPYEPLHDPRAERLRQIEEQRDETVAYRWT